VPERKPTIFGSRPLAWSGLQSKYLVKIEKNISLDLKNRKQFTDIAIFPLLCDGFLVIGHIGPSEYSHGII